MQPNLVLQFRSELTLSKQLTGTGRPAKVTFTSPDMQTAKALIQRVAPDATFSPAQENQASAIYHPAVSNGKKPCGSIGPWMQPQGYDLETTVTEQLERQAA